MKIGLTLIFAATILSAHGQLVKLEPSNPAPRVGDSFHISFSLEKNNLDSMEVSKDISEKLLVESMNQIGAGYLEISEWFLTEAGDLKIGPFQMPINNKTYTTNTLNIKVSPKLPENINEGIWIRLLNFQGIDYIILEQRHPGKMKPKTDSNGRTTYSMSTKDAVWTKLNMDKIQRKGIEIEEKNTRSSIQPIDIGDALYMVTVYSYKPLDSFKGELKIDKDLLIYVPDKGHFEVVRVKN
jgi:hypothetical protein